MIEIVSGSSVRIRALPCARASSSNCNGSIPRQIQIDCSTARSRPSRPGWLLAQHPSLPMTCKSTEGGITRKRHYTRISCDRPRNGSKPRSEGRPFASPPIATYSPRRCGPGEGGRSLRFQLEPQHSPSPWRQDCPSPRRQRLPTTRGLSTRAGTAGARAQPVPAPSDQRSWPRTLLWEATSSPFPSRPPDSTRS
jgi:hypothetical protein